MSADAPLQESAERKAEWLAGAMKRMPTGTRVTVVKSDVDDYIGQHGTVIGYDTGIDGDWPYVRVQLDCGITDAFASDANSDDEIVAYGVSP